MSDLNGKAALVSGDVRESEPGSGAPADPPVGEADHRVEVGTGDLSCQQDDHGQSGCGGEGVLQ
jgi:hypothetical protein